MKRNKSLLPPATVRFSTGPASPADPRTAGIGQGGVIRIIEKGQKLARPGKPPFGVKVKQNQIVGHVLYLQKLEPGRQLKSIIGEAAKFHGVKSDETVFAALRQYRQFRPKWFVDLGLVRGSRKSTGKN
jgi:hypothetical protein